MNFYLILVLFFKSGTFATPTFPLNNTWKILSIYCNNIINKKNIILKTFEPYLSLNQQHSEIAHFSILIAEILV